MSAKLNIRKVVILLGSMMTVMAGAAVAPALPEMSRFFSSVADSDFLVKKVLTIPALSIAIFAPFMGLLLDRVGRKKVVIFSLALYGLAGSTGLYLDSIFMIIAGRIFLGMAVAGIMTGFTTIIGDYFQGDALKKMMGYQTAFMGFGGALLLSAGGFLADISWRGPFALYLLAIALLPFVVVLIYEPKVERKGKRKILPNPEEKFSVIRLIIIYILAFLLMLIFYMVPVHLPFYLKEIGIVDNLYIGMSLAVMNTMGAISSIFYPRIKGNLSFRSVFSLAFALMGAGYFLVGFSSGYIQVIPGLVLGGIGMGMLLPNINLYLLSSVPESIRGRAVGALSSFYFLGQFLSPDLLSPLTDGFGIGQAFSYTGIFMLVLSTAFLVTVLKRAIFLTRLNPVRN